MGAHSIVMSRTFSTSINQRLVTHANGQVASKNIVTLLSLILPTVTILDTLVRPVASAAVATRGVLKPANGTFLTAVGGSY